MKAVILCGGFGTRLRAVVSDRPKSMADINGKPFLQYQIEYLIKFGINDFVLATGYMASYIEEYFKDGTSLGVNISYSYEDEPLGTAGAIKNAFNKVEDKALVLNGDTYYEININSLIDLYNSKKTKMAIALKYEENTERYGKVTCDYDDKIVTWNEKNIAGEGLINGGIYIIDKSLVSLIPEGKCSLENDLMPKWIKEENIYAKYCAGHFVDIGIPESLEEFIEYIKLPYKKVLFLDRDGTLNIDKGYTYRTEDLCLINDNINKVKQYKDKGYLLIVISNQSGISRNLFKEKDVDNFNRLLNENMNNIIDGFYYCPFHEDGVIEKYKKKSIYRKPSPGMLSMAEDDLAKGQIELYGKKVRIEACRIDKENSLMMGDKQKDLDCAEGFGIKGKFIDEQ